MKNKILRLLLVIAMLAGSIVTAEALEKSIQPVNEEGQIDNSEHSLAIQYENRDARVFYGSDGINIILDDDIVHFQTNFPVLKLIAAGDVNKDGYVDFLSYQNSGEYAAQIMLLDGHDGNVLQSYHFTRQDYNDDIGYTQISSYVQQLLLLSNNKAIVVYDYTIAQIDLTNGDIDYQYSDKDNIWKAVDLKNGRIAFSGQYNALGILNTANGELLKRYQLCPEYEIEDRWEEYKFPAVMNVWDLYAEKGIVYALSEDGYLYIIDPEKQTGKDEDFEKIKLGVIDADQISTLAAGKVLRGLMALYYSPTGLNEWDYFGLRFADHDEKYLLIDAYMGDVNSLATYRDSSSYPPKVLLFNKETKTVEAVIAVDGFSLMYEKSCFGSYEGNQCITFIGLVNEGNVRMVIYDLKGELLTQKDVSLSVLSADSRAELSWLNGSYLVEVLQHGSALISGDLSKVTYLYQHQNTRLLEMNDDSITTVTATNYRDMVITRYDRSMSEKLWEFRAPETYANHGIEFIATDYDYNKDGTNDVRIIVNQVDADDMPTASWFIVLDGKTGGELLNKRIKTGTVVVKKKKVNVYLIADSFKFMKDLDKDGKLEMVCSDQIYSSKNNSMIGYLSGYVDAEGIRLDIGDLNRDGIPDYAVISDKETRLYQSKLASQYGYWQVEYKKLGTYLKNDKNLKPMETSGLLGDLDKDGVSEIVLAGKNSAGYQTYKVYNGKTLEYLFDLCEEGVQDGEYYSAMEYDLDGDGFNEIYGIEQWGEPFIFSGHTGKVLLALNGDYGKWSDGKDRYHPDYLVTFKNNPPAADFVITEEDGNYYVNLINRSWDDEYYRYTNLLQKYDCKLGKVVYSEELNTQKEGSVSLVKVTGNTGYIGLRDFEGFSLLDGRTRKEIATYDIDPKMVFVGANNELLVSDSENQLFRLDTARSFELLNEVPEETAESTIPFRWKTLQNFSIMEITDNGTTVFLGDGDSAEIKLTEGAHVISLIMSDGQGKSYREAYKVNVINQKPSAAVPIAVSAVLLLIMLYLGIYQKMKIRRWFKGVRK